MNTYETARFRATTGPKEAFGETPQEAVTALMRQLPSDAFSPITIWPYNLGDAYFSEAQQSRLQNLKSCRAILTPEEYAELEGLVEASLKATVARAKSLAPVKS